MLWATNFKKNDFHLKWQTHLFVLVFSVPKINTNKLYTPEYFKNYYEEELVNEQTKMHQKLISF